MKFIPILFSTPMVQAEQAGRKTMTRRTNGLELINENSNDWQFEWADYALKLPWRFTQLSTINEKSLADQSFNQAALKCPYGQVGDILWVRETFYAFGHWIEVEKDGKKAMEFVDETQVRNLKYHHENTFPDKFQKKRLIGSCAWYKRPSLFMPKAACRTFLQITYIRVERLQDISAPDAVFEGIEFVEHYETKKPFFKDYTYYTNNALSERGGFYEPIKSFQSLWLSINGKGSWEANPYVWVIEFKRIEKPENFN